VVDNASESFLYFNYGLSLLHIEKLILLNQGMLPCSLHIIHPFICDFKYIPHFLCALTLGDPTKLIHVQRWRVDILCIVIILSFSPFFLCPFSPRLVHLLILKNIFRSVRFTHSRIPNTMVYWFNGIFHCNFTKLIVYTTKHILCSE